MNANELAQKMLEWGEKNLELALLTAEIESAVLELGKTQNVGNVRATYSKGHKRYDYMEAAALAEVSRDIIAQHTQTPEPRAVTDWRKLCAAEDIENIPFIQGETSVKVKVVA